MKNQSTIDPREVAKFASLSLEWWDKNGALKTLHDINPVRLEYMGHFIDISEKRILDIGCGGGILSESMAAQGAFVTGIDAEKEAIRIAQRHCIENHLTIDYQCTPVEEYESPPFEVITCLELLEHVKEPHTVLHHCARLLKPGGLLFLSTINRTLKAYASAIIAAEYLLGLLPRQTHEYDKFIKPSELAAMARRSGFELAGLRGMAFNPVTRLATLQDSVSVNYLMVLRRSNLAP